MAADSSTRGDTLAPRSDFTHCQRVQRIERVTLEIGDIAIEFWRRDRLGLGEGNGVLADLLLDRAGAQERR